jgi:hypothetical protein
MAGGGLDDEPARSAGGADNQDNGLVTVHEFFLE